MSEPPANDYESDVSGERRIGPVQTLRIRRADVLFRTLAYCENLRCHCDVVFTRTHFAWAPVRMLGPWPLFPLFRPPVYAGVEWLAINVVEFEFRRPDREKLIRITWQAPSTNEIVGLELTRIMQFNDWINPFCKVGFSPKGGNPFRLTALRGFICDYGPLAWVLLLAICSFVLFQFWREVWSIFPSIVHLLALPLWLWAIRKARQWFPPGTRVRLERARPAA